MAKHRAAAFVILTAATACLWAGRLSAGMPVEAPSAPMPTQLGPWDGSPLTLDERVYEILETRDVDSMEYRLDGGAPVWLARVSGVGKRAAFHPPEICYVGSHFEVLERGPISVMVNGRPQQVMRLVIGQNKERFEAWYWFTANNRVTSNYYQQQLWLMGDSLRRRPTIASLVRISTPMEQSAKSHARLLGFLNSLDHARLL